MAEQSTIFFIYNIKELLKQLQYTRHINDECDLFHGLYHQTLGLVCIPFDWPAFVALRNYISHDAPVTGRCPG